MCQSGLTKSGGAHKLECVKRSLLQTVSLAVGSTTYGDGLCITCPMQWTDMLKLSLHPLCEKIQCGKEAKRACDVPKMHLGWWEGAALTQACHCSVSSQSTGGLV